MSDLPPLPSHPEPHTYKWTAAEIAAIEAYARAAVAAERERIAVWVSIQRNFIPATGEEFAAAIRGMP